MPTIPIKLEEPFVFLTTSTTPDAGTISILSEAPGVYVETGGKKTPGAAMCTFSYVLRPAHARGQVVRQQFRGFVAREGAGVASLLVIINGVAHPVDLAAAVERAAAIPGGPRKPPAGPSNDPEAEPAGPPPLSADFYVEIITPVPDHEQLQVVVLALGELLPGEEPGLAMLTVDSVDMALAPSSAEACGSQTSTLLPGVPAS